MIERYKAVNKTVQETEKKLSKHAFKVYKDIIGYVSTKMSSVLLKDLRQLTENVTKTITDYYNFLDSTNNKKQSLQRIDYYTEKYIKQKVSNDIETECMYKNAINNKHMFYNNILEYEKTDKYVYSNLKETDIKEIEKIKQKTNSLKELNIINYKAFDSVHEALENMKQKNNYIIKANNGADGTTVFMKKNDKFYRCGFTGKTFMTECKESDVKTILEKYDKILVEESVLKNDHNYEIIPYRFYCGYDNVFCCGMSYHQNNISHFNKFKGGYLYLDKDKKQLEYQKEKMNKQEKNAFNKMICDDKTYNTMWNIAKELSKHYPGQRIDLFATKEKNGEYKIYFNEVQKNSFATLLLFSFHLTTEGFQKYNDMINLKNFDTKRLSPFQKILQEQEIKDDRQIANVVKLSFKGKPKRILSQIEKNGIIATKQSPNIYNNKHNQQQNIISIIPSYTKKLMQKKKKKKKTK